MPRKARRRTWGTGSLFEREGRWWIRWRENGRRKSKSFASEELAKEVLAKIVRDVAAGDAGLRPNYSEVPALDTLAKDWLARRMKTNRAARTDVGRWKHLSRIFGKMRPYEVNAANLRRFIEKKLAEGLAPTTVGHCIRLISSLFTDLREQGHVEANPVATLTRATRRLYRSLRRGINALPIEAGRHHTPVPCLGRASLHNLRRGSHGGLARR